MKLYPHQETAVSKLRNGSILVGGVGTGKSLTAMAYYDIGERPKDLYIITTAKKRDSLDWEKEAAAYGIGKEQGATTGGILMVDSWNNISRYEGVRDAFFIFDEQRLVGSGAWAKSFIKISVLNSWVMLTATPGDVWLDYCAVFVANGFFKNRTEFLREHVVFSPWSKFPKIERYLGVSKLRRLRDEITVEMPFVRHTTRISKELLVDFDNNSFNMVLKKRWHIYEERPVVNLAELFLLMRKVVNSHESRLDEVRSLMSVHPKLIIFYNFNFELDLLRGLSDSVTIAEWNGHKHESIPLTDRWVYLVQYISGAEGWNCIETNAMIFYSLTYSYKIFEQAYGRIDRLNTPYANLHYYVLMSNSMIDKAIWTSLMGKKSFNESNFASSRAISI